MTCQQCGMHVENATDYHPYAACLMFKACHDGNKVQANLDAVVEYGEREGRKDALGVTEADIAETKYESLP